MSTELHCSMSFAYCLAFSQVRPYVGERRVTSGVCALILQFARYSYASEAAAKFVAALVCHDRRSTTTLNETVLLHTFRRNHQTSGRLSLPCAMSSTAKPHRCAESKSLMRVAILFNVGTHAFDCTIWILHASVQAFRTFSSWTSNRWEKDPEGL
eukprot:870238-Pleurochrysis_carterae.AAC.1